MLKIIRTPSKATGGITEQERAALAEHTAMWIKRAFRTDPIDAQKIIPAIEGIYAAAGLKKPRVVIVPSPLVMAFAYGAAAAIWHARFNATDIATLSATLSATDNATDIATRDATDNATDIATDNATDIATRSVTHSVTGSATGSATRSATDNATRSATDIATHIATDNAAHIATDNAAHIATLSATLSATDNATDIATRDATDNATRSATDNATRSATDIATHIATDNAAHIATDNAAHIATRSVTGNATYIATRDAAHNATDIATDNATYSATRSVTLSATHIATYSATRSVTDNATHDATDNAAHIATRSVTGNATYIATGNAESGAADACLALAGAFGRECAKRWESVYQGGNMWAAYDCYLTAMRDVLGLRLPEHAAYSHWEMAAIHGGFRVMHPEFCMVSDFPEFIRIDDQNRPHCENGPSHRWRDGWSLYHWHGTRVPAHWIERRNNLDPAEVLKATNVEQRAAGAAIVGWPKMIAKLKRKIIDGDPNSDIGALIELTLPGLREPGRFLQAVCPRNGIIVEGVPRVSDIDGLPIETAIAAQAWRIGDPQSEYEHPPQRT